MAALHIKTKHHKTHPHTNLVPYLLGCAGEGGGVFGEETQLGGVAIGRG